MRNRLQGNDPSENCFPSDLVRQLVVVVAGILALAFTVRAGAESITLQWTLPDDRSEIDGYEVHYGSGSGQYEEEPLLANANGAGTDTLLVENLEPGETIFYATRSYNDDGRVSAFSNELPVTVPPPPVGDGDSDGDGVSDAADQCPGTPAGESADSSGCSASPVDSNGEGLIAAYGFEEDQGMVVVDASGNGHDGSLSGATRTTAGHSGSALAFDGTDDRVDLNALDISGGDGEGLTISAWMKADDFGIYDARLVSKASGSAESDHYWMVSTYSNNSIRFRLKAGGFTTTLISPNGVVAADQWHHVAATYDGARMTLYVDGAEVASTAKSGSIATNSSVPAAIGDQPQGGRPFDGSIDEVRIYSRTLIAADIQTDMTTTVALDADADGVSDAVDQCPNTPAGESVDGSGCSASQVDSDDDGVSDASDQCPGTPAGESADTSGCSASQTDSDGDGVSDAADQCPGTPAGESADSSGCSASQVDSDGDGVSDAADQCPGTPAGESADSSGCSASPVDSNGEGLIAAYGFEEDQGMAVVDASGNDHDGSLSGATRTTAGHSGSALAFDGTDDRVDLNALDISGGDGEGLTISAWMKADDFGTYDARLVSKASGSAESDHYWMVSTYSNNSIRFRLKAGGFTTTLISPNGVVAADQWHHVAATYDGARMTLYVDGAEVASTAKSGSIATNSSVPAAIGDQPQGGRPFDGSIDEVRIYSRTLIAADIQTDMTTTVALDADADGVSDAVDQCPNTPAGESVDGSGCSASQVDSDDDGVSDASDQCPGTPAGESADSSGCSASQTDSDGDGVSDAADQCPGTPAGESAATSGCSASQVDSDGDGVSDAADQCPGTPAGESADSSGCSASQVDSNSGVEGLTAAYGFEEDQGDMVVVDASGNGNDGVLYGATRTTAGHSGSALAFDGTDDRVDLNALDISGGDGEGLTISAWMKADDFGTYDARLVSKASGSAESDHYWMVSTYSNNSIRFRLKAGGFTTTLISPNGVVAADQWHHVAATYDGARMTLYVDGAEVASTAKSGSIATNSSVPAAIGDQPQGGKPFDGSIDEVRIYSRTLIAADIQTDMTTTAAVPAGTTYTAARSGDVTDTTDGALSDLLERGEIEVGDEWQRVDFAVPFADAIVVAKPISYNDTDPAVVRVDGIDANGFWIRVQEWGYLDGTHAPEVVSYLAMERGLHQLTDDTWIEAGRIDSDAGIETAFVRHNFQAPFTETPVVLTAVTSHSEGDPVITRVRNIDNAGFQVRLQEEEAADQIPMPAAIDYIAWEPSSGVIDGVEFEVGRTANEVTHVAHALAYQEAFAVPPVFVADMQTQNGSDPANLRWENKSTGGVDVWVAEEQSSDDEITHVAETVGYVAMDPSSFAQDPAEIEIFADSFETSESDGLWTEIGQNDWFRSSQRAIDGNRSAEVDDASDATLTSIPIDLQGRHNATIDFSWLIERGLDTNEYLAFDVSFDGGVTWTEQHRLRGNQDQEDVWHAQSVELTDIDQLRIRFRGAMSNSFEDANVDQVTVIAH